MDSLRFRFWSLLANRSPRGSEEKSCRTPCMFLAIEISKKSYSAVSINPYSVLRNRQSHSECQHARSTSAILSLASSPSLSSAWGGGRGGGDFAREFQKNVDNYEDVDALFARMRGLASAVGGGGHTWGRVGGGATDAATWDQKNACFPLSPYVLE